LSVCGPNAKQFLTLWSFGGKKHIMGLWSLGFTECLRRY